MIQTQISSRKWSDDEVLPNSCFHCCTLLFAIDEQASKCPLGISNNKSTSKYTYWYVFSVVIKLCFFLLYIEFIRRDPVSHFMLLYLCSTKNGENKTVDMKKEIKMFLTYSRLTTLDKKMLNLILKVYAELSYWSIQNNIVLVTIFQHFSVG